LRPEINASVFKMIDVEEITSRAEKKLLENDSNPEG
jgi:hypothetical protein